MSYVKKFFLLVQFYNGIYSHIFRIMILILTFMSKLSERSTCKTNNFIFLKTTVVSSKAMLFLKPSYF